MQVPNICHPQLTAQVDSHVQYYHPKCTKRYSDSPMVSDGTKLLCSTHIKTFHTFNQNLSLCTCFQALFLISARKNLYLESHTIEYHQMSIRSGSIVNKYGYNCAYCFTLLCLAEASSLNEPNVSYLIIGVSEVTNMACEFNMSLRYSICSIPLY